MADKTETGKPAGGESGRAAAARERRSRQARALRDNLGKRKEQARTRTRKLVEPSEPR
jgi:hypothetical protein